jgi:hypothetical protein
MNKYPRGQRCGGPLHVKKSVDEHGRMMAYLKRVPPNANVKISQFRRARLGTNMDQYRDWTIPGLMAGKPQ